MSGVFAGFAAIWAVTALGWLTGRRELFGPRAERVLARLAFFLLTPALLFTTLARSRPADLLTPALAAFAVSAVAAALAGVAVARLWRRRPAAESAVAALCASYVNAANLGIPVAAYVLGDVAAVAPVLLFQVLVAAPLALGVLDSRRPAADGGQAGSGPDGTGPDGTGPAGTGRRWRAARRLALLPTRNPIILASAAGIAVALVGWRPAAGLLRPVELLGQAAVPVALLALGLALAGAPPHWRGPGSGERYALVAIKAVGQPAVAYAVARHGFGLAGPALLTAVITAGLPVAQNVFVIATRYERAAALARDTVLLSTVVAAATLAVVAAALG
ncbi:MAG TPA: AEC family transporter [Pilimelia sp.]|nr:AEC family transporter [Pilimelia sp.]